MSFFFDLIFYGLGGLRGEGRGAGRDFGMHERRGGKRMKDGGVDGRGGK